MQVLSNITLAYTVEKSHRRRRLRQFVAPSKRHKKSPRRGFYHGRSLGRNYPIISSSSITVFFRVPINATQVPSRFSNKFFLLIFTRIEFSFNYLTVRFRVVFDSIFLCHIFLSFLSHLYRKKEMLSSFFLTAFPNGQVILCPYLCDR